MSSDTKKTKLVESAVALAHLDREIKRLTAQKNAVKAQFLPLAHELEQGSVTLSDGTTVNACKSVDKKYSKKTIVSYFGKAGEEFWSSLESRTRDYVSVTRPSGKKTKSKEEGS